MAILEVENSAGPQSSCGRLEGALLSRNCWPIRPILMQMHAIEAATLMQTADMLLPTFLTAVAVALVRQQQQQQQQRWQQQRRRPSRKRKVGQLEIVYAFLRVDLAVGFDRAHSAASLAKDDMAASPLVALPLTSQHLYRLLRLALAAGAVGVADFAEPTVLEVLPVDLGCGADQSPAVLQRSAVEVLTGPAATRLALELAFECLPRTKSTRGPRPSQNRPEL